MYIIHHTVLIKNDNPLSADVEYIKKFKTLYGDMETKH